MKAILNYIFFLLLLISVSSCKKFLNVRPDNAQGINPRTVRDFEEMLNSSTLSTPNYLLADIVSDDVAFSDKVLEAGGTGSFYVNAYLWAAAVWGPAEDDPVYNNSYRAILQMNIILDNISKADSGTMERKEIVTAQAKINRAYYYLQLANLYGTDHQPATAAIDLAVPLILHPDGAALPARNTVQQVYEQILKDLNEAASTDGLANFGVDVIHPGKAAALAMLARTHLYMGNYDAAAANAEMVLKIRNTLLDYRTFSLNDPSDLSKGVKNKPVTLKDQENNPEILFAKVCMDAGFFRRFDETLYLSSALSDVFGTKDLRSVYGFMLKPKESYAAYPTYNDNGVTSMQFNYSLGVPEMMLIKAECLARKGDANQALSLVNELRKFRYSDADYVPLEVTATADALTLVLQERRRELFLRGGLRLFDLKRLNRDVKFKKDLERVSLKDGTIKAILPAASPRYLIPFAPKIIDNNRFIIQNER
ncbi:tetratricopeptide (TPR) repeat protein [Pedobacter africanus]|uniref:Tetratricopeptide (TPR) repeat protein n=1 Tax=Pedobacter africanus TaxID=151894 RepID=A0ACC6L1N3_9SPHI|nr:RagB/SusD family nutrient uptake outer membrane protein [Pedobacter africanus]MDR6785236.1 tetratricopeptide (TPR) repeat protein [Pedobacter africanus]